MGDATLDELDFDIFIGLQLSTVHKFYNKFIIIILSLSRIQTSGLPRHFLSQPTIAMA